jgi:hypothetical protein
MAKKVYALKGFEDKGKEYRRSTDREYTHAVLLTRLNVNEVSEYVIGYCGRKDLADKLELSTLKRFQGKESEYKVSVHEVVRIK